MSEIIGESEVEQVKYYYSPIQMELQFVCEGGVTYKSKSKIHQKQ